MVTLLAMSMTSVYAVDQKWKRSAMLEQGDSIQLFYGTNALGDAYNAAADSGAVIMLSKGSWGEFSINKKIKLIGFYGFSSDYDNATLFDQLTIVADDVIIDGVFCNRMDVVKVNGLKIIHSCVNERLSDNGYPHVNTTIEQCYVGNFSDEFFANSANLRFYNSTLNPDWWHNNDNENIIYVTNCVVFINELDNLPYGAYHNNVMIVNDYRVEASFPNVYYYNTFIDESNRYSAPYLDFGQYVVREGNHVKSFETVFGDVDAKRWRLMYPVNPGTGSDGTPCGPLGGSGFTDSPQIPRVTGSDIDVYPDSAGKLNVKITVSAE